MDVIFYILIINEVRECTIIRIIISRRRRKKKERECLRVGDRMIEK